MVCSGYRMVMNDLEVKIFKAALHPSIQHYKNLKKYLYFYTQVSS